MCSYCLKQTTVQFASCRLQLSNRDTSIEQIISTLNLIRDFFFVKMVFACDKQSITASYQSTIQLWKGEVSWQ